MGLKASTIEQAKCEYSSLGKIFNKGLSEDDKKVGVSKRIKNIESKKEVQVQANKGQGEKQLDTIKNIDSKPLKTIVFFFSSITEKAKKKKKIMN